MNEALEFLKRSIKDHRLNLPSMGTPFRHPMVSVNLYTHEEMANQLVKAYGGKVSPASGGRSKGRLQWTVEDMEAVRVGRAIKSVLFGTWAQHVDMWEEWVNGGE